MSDLDIRVLRYAWGAEVRIMAGPDTVVCIMMDDHGGVTPDRSLVQRALDAIAGLAARMRGNKKGANNE